MKWFEKRGYKCVGAPKVSQNGKHATQLMERDESAASEAVAGEPVTAEATRAPPVPEEDEIESPTFLELLDEPAAERAKAELLILDGLMAKATRAEKFGDALKILDAAQMVLRRFGAK